MTHLSHEIQGFRAAQRVTIRGVSTSGSGVPRRVSCIRREWLGCPAHPWASLALAPGCSSGRFIPTWARVGPRLWSRFASSPASGASSWRPVHPVVARGSPRRLNWRWSRQPRPAHQARTPGRPVRAASRHATSWVQLTSALFTACRAMPIPAPISSNLTRSWGAAPPS